MGLSIKRTMLVVIGLFVLAAIWFATSFSPADPRANWLPTPADNFMVVLRMYEPSAEALAMEYLLPRIERFD